MAIIYFQVDCCGAYGWKDYQDLDISPLPECKDDRHTGGELKCN